MRQGDAGRRLPRDRAVKVSFHLSETLLKRLGVHCELSRRNKNATVEQVLGAYLTRHGQGREIFGPEPRGGEDGPPLDPPTV